jgi:hypothetical protein
MTNPCKFFFLRPQEQSFLLRAVLLLWACRLGLWLLPFKTLRRLMAKITSPSKRNPPKIDTIIWAVAVASRYVPAATCLTQALAGQVLLNRYDAPALLRIGVAKNEQGAFQAHAWVESQGRILIGNSPELFRYTRLTEFEGDLL